MVLGYRASIAHPGVLHQVMPSLIPHVVGSRTSQFTASGVCRQCLRPFTTTTARDSGHNKWSKTKHIKAATDKKKMQERTAMAKSIALFSRRKYIAAMLLAVTISMQLSANKCAKSLRRQRQF